MVKRLAPRRAVGYVRISKNRTDETSTTTQEQAIRAYGVAHGIEVVDVVIEAGRSAFQESRSSRPGMRRAMAIIEAGAADAFIVWKVDRASRNTRDLLALVDDLATHGATFASVTEQFDTGTPMGRTMLTLVAALAELESGVKSERTQAWHDHRRTPDKATGRVTHAPPSKAVRGYHHPARNKLAIHPVEGPLIREAFARVAAGATLHGTLTWLGTEGVTLTQRGLKSCLTSPTIAGLRDTGEGVMAPGEWPALVPVDEWRRVREMLTHPDRQTNFTRRVRQFGLTGLVTCHCGEAMITKRHPRGHRLLCRTCNTGIPYAFVEALLDREMLAKLDDSRWRTLRSQGRATGADVDAIRARLTQLVAMAEADPAWGETDGFRLMVAELEGQIVASEGDAFKLPTVASVRTAWPTFTPDQKRLVYLAMIESVTIGRATAGVRGVDPTRIRLSLVA
jgi:DNA invertase Pin-like site-specific DNA recombinase